jgi:hypothetical protein
MEFIIYGSQTRLHGSVLIIHHHHQAFWSEMCERKFYIFIDTSYGQGFILHISVGKIWCHVISAKTCDIVNNSSKVVWLACVMNSVWHWGWIFDISCKSICMSMKYIVRLWNSGFC